MKGGKGEGLTPFKFLSPFEGHQSVDGIVNFLLKHDRIVQPVACGQFRFGIITDIMRNHEPLIRADNFSIIHFFNFRANSGFGDKFLSGHEVVEQEAEGAVDGGQSIPLCGGGETAVADKVSDGRVVFLLDKAVVVFAVGPGTGKLEMFRGAPFEHGGIDKLRAVVAVQAPQGERERGFDVRECFENQFMGFVEQGAQFHPTRTDNDFAKAVAADLAKELQKIRKDFNSSFKTALKSRGIKG